MKESSEETVNIFGKLIDGYNSEKSDTNTSVIPFLKDLDSLLVNYSTTLGEGEVLLTSLTNIFCKIYGSVDPEDSPRFIELAKEAAKAIANIEACNNVPNKA